MTNTIAEADRTAASARPRNLRDAVVVVTGASSGVGHATALAFADNGSRLVLAARSRGALEDVAQACRERGAQATVVPTDITQDGAAEDLRQAAVEAYGRVDIWVEGAAVLAAGLLEDHSVEDIRAVVDTNVAGSALGARAALQQFREQGSGTLIIVSSMLGILPNPLVPIYTMTKFAMRGLALSLRQAVVGERHINVCTVMPGPIDTPMFQRAANATGHELRSIPPAIAPERIAATIVACAKRPRRQATAGVLSHAILAAHRVSERATEFAVAQYSARMITRGDPAPRTSGALHSTVATALHGGWRRGSLRRAVGERVGTLLGR